MKTADPPVLDRILDPVSACLTPEVARALVNLRADPVVQDRIGELAAKSNEGTLTPAERSQYETYVAAIDFVAVLQSKARALLAKSGRS
jgi:hypothetical protein